MFLRIPTFMDIRILMLEEIIPLLFIKITEEQLEDSPLTQVTELRLEEIT